VNELITRVRSAFTELENALGEYWDELPAPNTSRVGSLLKAVEALHHGFDTFTEQDTRDDAYERAAARDRADGFERTGGKDWT
jgi:hypothetical protein